ncbi:hypothetical protein [Chryseobacterium aureum]|uniref:hypothetical protein n=1 Tax=Chryseobacterium aureum TaxID=2497456 RepID=UPI0013E0C553|nr:hypothetical protein [Chryseobacterium aureum]
MKNNPKEKPPRQEAKNYWMNEKLILKVGNIHSAIYEYSHKPIQITDSLTMIF